MPKAARILAALQRDGWVEVRRRGSHRLLAKGNRRAVWAWPDGSDLGGPATAIIAKEFGYTVDELRRLYDQTMKLRVEYLYDDEAKVWAFRVPGLHVVGGGDADRADAERHCLDAIGFALECLEAENVGPESEVVEYDVRLIAS